MNKPVRITLKVLLGVIAFFAVVIGVAEIVLQTKISDKIIGKLASEYVDGEVRYANLDVSLFSALPNLRVSVDSLSVTYPHERFARFDRPGDSRLYRSGRGQIADTLASLNHLHVAVNPWKFLSGGRIRVSDFEMDKLRVFAREYDDSTANWNMFRSSGSDAGERKDSAKSRTLRLSVKHLNIGQKTRFVYTSQLSETAYSASVQDLTLSGAVRMGDGFKLRGISLDIDSVRVHGRANGDTLALRMDYLNLDEKGRNDFTLAFGAEALARTRSFGRLRVPLVVDSRLELLKEDAPRVSIRKFDANLAHIPLSVSGDVKLYKDSTCVNAALKVDGCPIDTVLAEYGPAFLPIAKDISTDARLFVEADADGAICRGKLPKLGAKLEIPTCNFHYLPLDVRTRLALAVTGSMSPTKNVRLSLDRCKLDMNGLALDVDGRVEDLLGGNPAIDCSANAEALLDSLCRLLPDSLGLVARGNVGIDASANCRLDELTAVSFESGGTLEAHLTGDALFAGMAADSAEFRVFRPRISARSMKSDIGIMAEMDSVFVVMGKDVNVRVRNMNTRARAILVEKKGTQVMRCELENETSRASFKTGDTRVMARGLDLVASLEQRVRADAGKRTAMLDSLQKVYPDVPRRDLVSHMRAQNGGAEVPVYLQEKDFRKGDLKVTLDSTVKNFIRQWDIAANVGLKRGSVAMPALPLRTRLSGLRARFDGNNLDIDTLSATCGTSDIALEGKVKGIRRTLLGRGTLSSDLDIYSRRINLNEIISAAQYAKARRLDTLSVGEDDESFIVDSLANAVPDSTDFSLVIVPANLNANVNILADNVDYIDYHVSPFITSVDIRERTVHLKETNVQTDFGKIGLDAYYSTQTKKDISMGLDLKLDDVTADRIIKMLPAVDDLMPALKSFKGNLGCRVAATTQLDTNMNVIIPTLNGIVRISGEDLSIEDAGDLKKITTLLMFKDKNIGNIDNMYVDAVVSDSKVEVFPFVLGVDRYQIALSGVQGFDKSMFYHASILKSPFLVKFGINVFGSLDKWRFSIGKPNYADKRVAVNRLDTLQINMARSIRHVLDNGVTEVMKYNESMLKSVDRSQLARESDISLLSAEEQSQIDSLSFIQQLDEEASAVESEVEAALEYTAPDMLVIDADLDALIEDKEVAGKLARLRKQSEKSKSSYERH